MAAGLLTMIKIVLIAAISFATAPANRMVSRIAGGQAGRERRGFFATGVGHESGFGLAGRSRDNFRDE